MPNYAQKRAFSKLFANQNSEIKNTSAKTHRFEMNKVSKPNCLVRYGQLTKRTMNILKNAFELAGPSFTAFFHTLKLYRLLYFESKIPVPNFIELLTPNIFSNIHYVYNEKRYGQLFQKISDKQNFQTF